MLQLLCLVLYIWRLKLHLISLNIPNIYCQNSFVRNWNLYFPEDQLDITLTVGSTRQVEVCKYFPQAKAVHLEDIWLATFSETVRSVQEQTISLTFNPYALQFFFLFCSTFNVESLLDLKILSTYSHHIAPLYHCHSFSTDLLEVLSTGIYMFLQCLFSLFSE